MTNPAALVRPLPRRRDAEATRAAILEAAKKQFARVGYDCTLRDIAGEAGADVALVKRYFGGKEALFIEALRASFVSNDLHEWNRETISRELAASLAGSPHEDEARTQRFQFLLRAATSPATAPLLNVIVQDRFLGPIRDWLEGPDSEARARVFAATYIGFLVERLIRGEALQGREREIFIDRATAVFQTLIAE